MKPQSRRIILVSAVLLLSVVALFGFTLARIGYFSLHKAGAAGEYIGNFHTHTIASDGSMSYNEAVEEAISLGFGFIAITDHNVIGSTTRLLCPIEKRLLCIIGEEVSTTEGHVLAIGINRAIPLSLSPEETIRLIHEQGGIAIPAHPEYEGSDIPIGQAGLKMSRIKGLGFDAVECHTIDDGKNRISYDYPCEQLQGFARIYDSDAHNTKQMQILASRCALDEYSQEGVIRSIKDGRCAEWRR